MIDMVDGKVGGKFNLEPALPGSGNECGLVTLPRMVLMCWPNRAGWLRGLVYPIKPFMVSYAMK